MRALGRSLGRRRALGSCHENYQNCSVLHVNEPTESCNARLQFASLVCVGSAAESHQVTCGLAVLQS